MIEVPPVHGVTFGGMHEGGTPYIDVRFQLDELNAPQYREFVERVFANALSNSFPNKDA